MAEDGYVSEKKPRKKKPTRKTLPNDINDLLEVAEANNDYGAVYESLERCLPDARGSFNQGTLLMNRHCTLELARWSLERGTDINASNRWGRSALHESASCRFNYRLTPAQLIELGADVHQRSDEGLTPLHSAADGKHVAAIHTLLEHGADVNARANDGRTPLDYSLLRLSNSDLVAMLPVAQALLDAGSEITEKTRDSVLRASEKFEFHRAGFNRDLVEEVSAAAAKLCTMFSVEAAPRRRMHDGTSPIAVSGSTLEERFGELWELLVPSLGHCEVVQGEVIRIAGRIHDEWQRNGGVNWDRAYQTMGKAFLKHVATHHALETEDLEACAELVGALRQRSEDSEQLVHWAVKSVSRNPIPIPLAPPSYKR